MYVFQVKLCISVGKDIAGDEENVAVFHVKYQFSFFVEESLHRSLRITWLAPSPVINSG